ncbi:hypothetical protein [Burkholderia pyrrocinia]|uniref:hypothetical protein n=1 Tax=Burkholderia pyrrocinia TaxID=60550 RepID=UPI0021AD3F91|nr:hypothetical protein [Burkholderia pyrrocinia]
MTAIWIVGAGSKPVNGSCAAISQPMMPNAPMLQQIAYIARRSREPWTVRRERLPATAAGATGAPAGFGADAATGHGCQRHAR